MEFEMISFDAIRVYDFITKTYENFLEFQKQSIHNLEITNVAEFKILQILIHQITS
jgi:hypothetical protein